MATCSSGMIISVIIVCLFVKSRNQWLTELPRIKKQQHYFITDNPGIGKSFFRMHFHIFVKQEKAVEYDDGEVHLFNQRDPKFCKLHFASDSVPFSFLPLPHLVTSICIVWERIRL